MSVAPQSYSEEETISLIAARAQALTEQGNPPLFEVMLNRRDKGTGVSQSIASLSQATLEQIQDPMRWVPMLCGGGEYVLNVRHAAISGRIGGPLRFVAPTEGPGMQPRHPDPRVTLRPDWQGPAKILAPALEQPAPAPSGATATGPQFTTGYGPPIQVPTPTVTQQTDRERELQQQLADMRANQARLEAESKAAAALDAVKRDADARIREAEQRAERARTESDQRMRDLETRIAAITAAPPAAPKSDPLDTAAKLFALFQPFIQQLMTQMHEARQAALKLNEEANRRQIEAGEKQHAAQMEMMRALTATKPGMSDEMKMLIETLRAQANQNGMEGQATMLTRMSEAMGIVTKSSMAMVESAVDALGGEPDHPAVIAIREGVGALTALMKGQNEAAMKTVKKPQPQLPAGQRMPNIPGTNIPMTPAQVQALRAQHAQRVAAQQAAGKQPQPQAPQQKQPTSPAPKGPPNSVQVSTPTSAQTPTPAPVPVVEFKAPEAAPVVEATPGFTPEGYPEAQAGTGLSHFQVLAAGIQSMKEPQQVASYFIDLVEKDEPSLKAQLDAVGGSPFMLVQKIVGGEFITANQEYFKALGKEVDAQGTERNVWGEADKEDVAADEAEEAAEEEEAAAEEAVAAVEPVPA